MTGLLGSGRSELARVIYGADRNQSGTLKVDGKEAKIFSKDWAKDLAWALCLNGNPAIPMIKPNYLDLVNPKKKEDDNNA